jgi:hypothetical protein
VFQTPAACTLARTSPTVWAAPGQQSGSRASQLPIIRLLQRSQRQRLAAAGGHDAASWACLRRHDIRVGGRSVAGAAARRGRPRAARGADGASRPELAGLVRRVHGARASRRRAAAINRLRRDRHQRQCARRALHGP